MELQIREFGASFQSMVQLFQEKLSLPAGSCSSNTGSDDSFSIQPSSQNMCKHGSIDSGLIQPPPLKFYFSNERICGLFCLCSCHKESRIQSPDILQHIVGRLFIGYSGVPFLTRACNRKDCQRRVATKARIGFAFPSWLAHQAITASYSPRQDPERLLRVLKVRSKNDNFFAAFQDGHTLAIRYHIETGKGSWLDVDEYGRSPMHVCKPIPVDAFV